MAENVIIHEISLSGYKATSDGMLDLGTWGSYGVEKLHCTFDEVWRELTITAFFNVKGEVVGKALVGKDGYADVPWEATKENTFAGRIVFEGSMNSQRRISANLNFKVTNHSEFEDSDPVPTDDRWNQFVTQNKEYRDGAYEAATKAEARAEDAEAASEDAQAAMRAVKASEDAAADSENAAKGSEDKAKASADAAARSETNASASERAAAGSAAAAATSEGNAAESAKNAASAAKKAADESVAANIATLKQIQSDVTTKQNNAAASANAAADAEQGALAAQAAAETAVTNAGTAATRAETAAGTATAAANDAGQSASDAAASKAAAETAAQAAQEAQDAAAAAKADAVKAQTAAQAAAKTAKDAQSAAEKARDDAQTAQQGAEAARDAAAGSAEAAAKSEENAKQSADTLAGTVENVAANTAAVAELREKKAEIDDTAVGADAWSSKHIIDMLCPPLEESGNPVVCYPVAGYPLGVKTKWEPTQKGSGTPSPENIRPIKGRDSVTVERCGKNLLDISAFSLDVDKDNRTYQTKVQQLIPPGKYTLKLTHTNPNSGLGIQVFTKNGNKVSFISGQAFNLDDICDSMYFYIRNVSGNADSIKDIMLIPSTATATTTTYTPYTGQTNTLTLPKTVYGGEVDAVTGEGQETWRLLNNPSSYNYYEGTAEGGFVQSEDAIAWFLYNPAFFSKAPKVLSNIFNVVSDIARTVNPYTIGGKNNYIAFRLPRSVAATGKDVKNWLASNGVEIAFEAITQTPFTATGAQPIPALAGANTVLTDADSATVTGRADPIKRIEDLEAAVASIN